MTRSPLHWVVVSGVVLAAGLVAVAAATAVRTGSGMITRVDRSQDSCTRPYADGSPWNTRIAGDAVVDAKSQVHIAALRGALTSDPKQYTYPVYEVTKQTPRQQVRLSGWFTNVIDGGRTLRNQRGGSTLLPIPDGAAAAAGADAQIILLDPATGDEWGASNLRRDSSGRWWGWNASHYNTRWTAVAPRDASGRPFFARGSGIPYLAGLVRPCEIAQGRIEHALAFAYDYPTPAHVYPATKSDGKSTDPSDMAEGTRLQLDPGLTEAQIRAWGCRDACLTAARALQEFGMYVVDAAGRPKVMFEYEGTARWNGLVSASTVSPIPLSSFRVLESCTLVGTPAADVLHGAAGRDIVCGLGGDDRIASGGGNDTIYGDAGADRLSGSRGEDRILGGDGDDRILGGPDEDRLNGGRGEDAVDGEAGDDVIYARDRQRDRVSGGRGRDRARVDPGFDRSSSVETLF